MDNLYVVESPLQALCALEVSLGKKNESHAIIIRVSSGDRLVNDKQIFSIIKKRSWDFTKVITHSRSSYFLNNLSNLKSLFDIETLFRSRVKSLYIGEFRSSYMHMIRVAVKPSKVYLLDDGAVSIKVINNYINRGFYYPYDSIYPVSKFKKAAFKFIYKRYLNRSIFNQNIQVLTSFSDKSNIDIEQLSFNNIKKLINKNESVDESLVYYYGSKYSEVGIISRNYEVVFLHEVKRFYRKKGKKIIYFAHRDESREKLDYISKKIGFKVITSPIMAELYLLESKILPSEIAGAYSSILNNVKIIFPEISVRSFELDPNEIGLKWRQDIELVYEYYKKINMIIER